MANMRRAARADGGESESEESDPGLWDPQADTKGPIREEYPKGYMRENCPEDGWIPLDVISPACPRCRHKMFRQKALKGGHFWGCPDHHPPRNSGYTKETWKATETSAQEAADQSKEELQKHRTPQPMRFAIAHGVDGLAAERNCP